jgi:hypothetical protein
MKELITVLSIAILYLSAALWLSTRKYEALETYHKNKLIFYPIAKCEKEKLWIKYGKNYLWSRNNKWTMCKYKKEQTIDDFDKDK